MPSNHHPLGALPSRFRRERVLIVGCGDIGLRAARLLASRTKIVALTSSMERVAELRSAGVTPVSGNLDEAATLRRLSGLASRVLHLAPPAQEHEGAERWQDRRTKALLRALRLRSLPGVLVYGSTSGVYGNCAGARIDERRPVHPETLRAHRRVDAERHVRWLGRAGVSTRILRIPGIYAPDRRGGMPLERLKKGTPVLRPDEDVYTNHIHADDLARICVAALWRGGTQRAFNANDDSELHMGDYMDLAADLYGLQRPPRISLDAARAELPIATMSFMGESRRLDNARLKRELRVRLRYPTVATGLLPSRASL
ncbi:MAG: NAD(P)H-binding protein [Gammaproteobacteria bacterium]|nr:NAD(P)H-binding protein [Gammaproteobacteria bacterium]MBU1444188.1 NAD(P)H-binding protein [Gammaproteobacteria bacterium]